MAPYKLTHPTVRLSIYRLKAAPATVAQLAAVLDMRLSSTKQLCQWLQSMGFAEVIGVQPPQNKAKIYALTTAGWL